MRYVLLVLTLVMFNPVSAVDADAVTDYQCEKPKCENITIRVPGPPSRVELVCKNGQDLYPPEDPHVNSQNFYVNCTSTDRTNGYYRYSYCGFNTPNPPAVHHFNVTIGMKCN